MDMGHGLSGSRMTCTDVRSHHSKGHVSYWIPWLFSQVPGLVIYCICILFATNKSGLFLHTVHISIYIYTIERSFPHALIWSCSFPLVRQYTKRETPISSGKDILPKVGQSWIFHGSGWLSSISHDLTYNAVEGKSLPSKKKCPWNSELSVVSLVDLFFIFFLPYWFRFSRE